MKIVSTDVARTTWLFPTAELNPHGRSMTKAFWGFAEKYKFKSFPKHSQDVNPEAKGLVFDGAEFRNKQGDDIVAKMTIFTDGIVTDTWSSTADAEDFLKDAMKWLKSEHGLSIPADRSVKTLYVSQLTVTTDKKLVSINPQLQGFADLVASRVGDRWGDNTGMNVGGISFWPNDLTKPSAPAPFRFEVKAGTTVAEKRYFTIAALQTDVHLEMLNKLEEMLS